jgi:hypothetical protein
MSRQERNRRKVAAELRAIEYEKKQIAMRKAALHEIRSGNYVERYHQGLNGRAISYWHNEGFNDDTINGFYLGYCAACPMDYPDHRPSVTIPVYARGILWNIRHRILGAEDGDKYRPQTKNLPRVLFNADNLMAAPSTYIMLVEGEKKSMMATQVGWWSVGTMGQDGFNPEWADAFRRFKNVYVILDPDARESAVEIAQLFGERGHVVDLPEKLDDYLAPNKGGADPSEVLARIESGRL